MRFLILVLVLTTFFSQEGLAKRHRKNKGTPFRIELVAHPDRAKILESLPKGKFTIMEKEFDAKTYCNQASLAKPEQIEIFTINRRRDRVLVLCPGDTGGEKNAATIFYPDREPIRKDLMPPKGATRVTNAQLQDAFGKSLKSNPDDEES